MTSRSAAGKTRAGKFGSGLIIVLSERTFSRQSTSDFPFHPWLSVEFDTPIRINDRREVIGIRFTINVERT